VVVDGDLPGHRDVARPRQLERDRLAGRDRQRERGLADALAAADDDRASRVGDDRQLGARRLDPPRRWRRPAAAPEQHHRAAGEHHRRAGRADPPAARGRARDALAGQRRGQLVGQRLRGRRPRRRILGQRPREHAIAPGRQRRAGRGGDRRHRAAEVLLHHRRQARRVERRLAGQQLEGEHPERVAIRRRARAVGGLLRGHVRGAAS
jgi:hypothetical protein